jgi:hypothetical protein
MARRSASEAKGPDSGALVAERAYYKAERRGFVPGYELEDWLAAEREINASDKVTTNRKAAKSRSRKRATRAGNGTVASHQDA